MKKRVLQMMSKRLPSGRDILLAYVGSALIVYNWMIIQYLYRVPGWLYYQTGSDVAAILGYGLVFAAIESALLLLVPIAAATFLPWRFFRDHFAVAATSWVLITGLWAAAIQHGDGWLRESSSILMIAAVSAYILTVVGAAFLVYRFEGVRVHVRSLLNRAALLLYFFYIPATFLGLLVVTLRNIR